MKRYCCDYACTSSILGVFDLVLVCNLYNGFNLACWILEGAVVCVIEILQIPLSIFIL